MAVKKIPKQAIPLVAIGVLGGGYLLYKRKKKNEENVKSTEQNPYLAQSFIPVTGENVAGVGAVSGGGFSEDNSALIQAQSENQQLIFSLLENQQTVSFERQATNNEFLKDLIESIKNQTGGGAPASSPAAGTVTATSSGGTKTQGNTPEHSCPTAFPLYNPTPGKGCYRISRTLSQHGCQCHGYKNGKIECQQGNIKNGSCHW